MAVPTDNESSRLKVICLTPMKNEAWILDRFLECASLWADQIIIADQQSDDGSREMARRHPKVTLVDNSSRSYSEGHRQKLLLEAARRIPGRRLLIALDADEMLTANVLRSAEWRTVLQAPVGTVVYFRWVNLLPGVQSYWSPPGEFAWGFVDDGSEHVGSHIHSQRLPVPTRSPSLTLDDVRVLHYQYTDWERMRSKHRWYQAWERLHHPERHPIDVYRQYHHMDTVPRRAIKPLPHEWIDGYEQHGIDMTTVVQADRFWWDRELLELLAQNGPPHFRREAIWDVDWTERNRLFDVGHGDAPFRDPRRWSDKLVQRWLRTTQPAYGFKPIRAVDRALRRVYR